MNFFSKDKWIQTRLNLIGYQAFRYFAAHIFRILLKNGHSNEYRELRKNGVLIIEDFLGREKADQLKKKSELLGEKSFKIGEFSEIRDRDTLVKRRTITLSNLSSSKEKKFLENYVEAITDRLANIFSIEKKYCIENQRFWFDNIIAQPGDSSQSEPHTDTYFPNYKVWYFPEEIKKSDIPLIIYSGTGRFSFSRMFFEYRQSIMAKPGGEHSWRAKNKFRAELEKCKKTISCKGDTLVVADVHAFHHRASNKTPCRRIQLHATLTREPFNQYTP